MGVAEVLAEYTLRGKQKGGGSVAGCKVTSGEMTPDTSYQVVRNEEVVWSGKIQSLRL